MKHIYLATAIGLGLIAPAFALDPAQKTLIDSYFAVTPGNIAAGKTLFMGNHQGGKPDLPSCTTCHNTDLKAEGKSKTGKPIAAMAASVAPKRYTDKAEVEKWFKRNCMEVLVRECTAQEKSDTLAFLGSL